MPTILTETKFYDINRNKNTHTFYIITHTLLWYMVNRNLFI